MCLLFSYFVERIKNEKGWPVLFAMFGPLTIAFSVEKTLALMKRVADIVNGGYDIYN